MRKCCFVMFSSILCSVSQRHMRYCYFSIRSITPIPLRGIKRAEWEYGAVIGSHTDHVTVFVWLWVWGRQRERKLDQGRKRVMIAVTNLWKYDQEGIYLSLNHNDTSRTKAGPGWASVAKTVYNVKHHLSDESSELYLWDCNYFKISRFVQWFFIICIMQ